MSVESFTLPSFAKINWRLSVLGRRADGLHELRTVFQTLTLHDQLTFTTLADGSLRLSCDSDVVPVDESNLILRAARALRERYGVSEGASIHLEKVIPVEAGLGGGSSNAAVALLGLTRLWGVETDRPGLIEIGARLGADVPFFFTGGTAAGSGLGSEVRPIREVMAGHLLVVKPQARVSTEEAYKLLNARALTKADSAIILSISRADEQFADSYPNALHNDFEPVIFPLKPEIERAKEALLEAGARVALMAGSGSSVFGVFENREAQERAAGELVGMRGLRVFPCATLSRAEYLKAMGACAALLGESEPPKP